MWKFLVSALCLTPLLCGCMTTAQREEWEQKQIARHTFKTTMDKLYPSTVQSFVEAGCKINNSDKDAGLVSVQCDQPELFTDSSRSYSASTLIKENTDGSYRIDILHSSASYTHKVDGQLQTEPLQDWQTISFWDSFLDRIHAKIDTLSTI